MLPESRFGKKKINISIVHRSVSRGYPGRGWLHGWLLAVLWLMGAKTCLAGESVTPSASRAANPDAALCALSRGQPLSLSLGRGPLRVWIPIGEWHLFAPCSTDFDRLSPEEREAIHTAWQQCRAQRLAGKTAFQRIERKRAREDGAVRRHATRPAFNFYRCIRKQVVSGQSAVGSSTSFIGRDSLFVEGERNNE